MARKKMSAGELKGPMAKVEETFHEFVEVIERGVDGSADDLRELQRGLVLLARDATAAACSLYSTIRVAESEEALRRE